MSQSGKFWDDATAAVTGAVVGPPLRSACACVFPDAVSWGAAVRGVACSCCCCLGWVCVPILCRCGCPQSSSDDSPERDRGYSQMMPSSSRTPPRGRGANHGREPQALGSESAALRVGPSASPPISVTFTLYASFATVSYRGSLSLTHHPHTRTEPLRSPLYGVVWRVCLSGLALVRVWCCAELTATGASKGTCRRP